MNRRQNNTFRMSKATVSLMDDHQELWVDFPVIATQKAKIEGIQEQLGTQKDDRLVIDTRAHTKTKNEKLSALGSRTGRLAIRARALARINKDNELLLATDYTKRQIERGSDQDTMNAIHKIVSAVEPHEAILVADYNLGETELAEIKTETEAVDRLIVDRTTTNAAGKSATAQVSDLVQDLVEEWELMDDLVEGIIDDADFVDTYYTTRRIGR